MTNIISTIHARENFSELMDLVAHSKERVILTRRGKEIAAIIPIEDLQKLEDSQDKRDLLEAVDSLKEARSAGTITLDKLKEEAGL